MKRLVSLFAIWLLALVFIKASCCNKTPTVPIKPIGNAQSFVGVTENYRTVSTDPNSKKIEYVFDWHGGFDTTELAASGETTGHDHKWTATGSFDVKAMAITEDNRVSLFSDPLTVTVGANDAPGKPDQVTFDRPAATPGEKVEAKSKATDPNGDSIYIKFFYDYVHDPTKATEWLGPVPSGAYVYDTTKWLKANDTPYTVVCLARERKAGAQGLISDTSDKAYFTISPVGVGWVYPDNPDNAQWPFSFTAALKSAVAGEVTVLAAADGESAFAFVDNGGSNPTAHRHCLDNEYTPSMVDAMVLSEDNARVYVPADNCAMYMLGSDNLNQIGDTFPAVYDSVTQEFFAPAVKGNLLYAGRGDSIVCLQDMGTGMSYVRSYIGGSGVAYPPVINLAGDRLFYSDDSGLVCIDNNCNLVWVSKGGTAPSCAAAIDASGTVWIGRQDGKLYAYAQTGNPATDTIPVFSSAAKNEDIQGCPVIGPDGRVYVVRADASIQAYAGTGTEQQPLWDVTPISGSACSAPPCLAPDSTIIIHTDDDNVIALRLYDNGSTKWRLISRSSRRPAITGSPSVILSAARPSDRA